MPDPNTRTAAHPAAIAVRSCCTACSNCSNYVFSPVELRRFELLTSCLPSGGSTSTRVHPRRSPSSCVPARPPLSVCVAVLPCCTAPVPRRGSVPARYEGLDQRQPCITLQMSAARCTPHSIKQLL